MLYDPNWQKTEVKSDPFSLESLIAWLEKQPADQRYDFCDPFACLAFQYLRASGFSESESALSISRLKQLGWYDIVHHEQGSAERTFGAALERARAALASR